MLNFNQNEMKISNKTSKKEEKLIHLKKDTIIIINNELRQYYFFTPEEINTLFRYYIYDIDKKETLFKRKRFQSMSSLYQVNINDNPIFFNGFDFSQKLAAAISNNLEIAVKQINNYNHISIWKTLLHLTEQTSFKLIYNKLIGNKNKTVKKKKKLIHNDLNKSFEKEKKSYGLNYNKIISPSSIELITTVIINQLSKIIDYLIDDYSDIYLATMICYLFKPILFHDEVLQKRILRIIEDCVHNLRKYQLYVPANHLVKYVLEGQINLEEKNYIFKYSCKDCKENEKFNLKNGKFPCGKGLFCEVCDKKITGLFIWCQSCGHQDHLSHFNKLNENYNCKECEKTCSK